MGRPKLTKKKETISIYLTSELLEEFKLYCKENNIENYSEYIEKILKKNIEKV